MHPHEYRRVIPDVRPQRNEMNKTKQQYHPLTFVSFLMAVFLLLPLTDAIFIMVLRKHLLQALTCAIISLASVIVPLTYAEMQSRRHLDRWKPRSLTKVTWAIVILTMLCNMIALTNALTKAGPSANQSAHGTR